MDILSNYLKLVVLACFIPASANQRSVFSVRHMKEAEDVGDYLRKENKLMANAERVLIRVTASVFNSFT